MVKILVIKKAGELNGNDRGFFKKLNFDFEKARSVTSLEELIKIKGGDIIVIGSKLREILQHLGRCSKKHIFMEMDRFCYFEFDSVPKL